MKKIIFSFLLILSGVLQSQTLIKLNQLQKSSPAGSGSVIVTDGTGTPTYSTIAAIGGNFVPYTGAVQSVSLGTWNGYANNFASKSTNVTSSASTTSLTVLSTRMQQLSGATTHTFNLPDATTLFTGFTFEFNNNSTGVLAVNDNGGNLITTVSPGGYVRVFPISVSTANGGWDKHFLIPANGVYGTSGLAVTGSITASTSFSAGTTGSFGTSLATPIINGVSSGSTGLTVSVSNTASSGSAKAINFTPTISAAANSDNTYGVYFTPTFSNAAFTSVSNFALGTTGNAQFNVGTVTNGYQIRDLFGTPSFGAIYSGVTPAATNYLMAWQGAGTGDTYLNGMASGSAIDIRIAGTQRAYLTNTTVLFSPGASTTGTATTFSFVQAARTGITAGSECFGMALNFSGSKTWANVGSVPLQREVIITAPTYVSTGGVTTMTDMATFALTGAAIKGTSVTATNSHGILISSNAIGAVTNGYGITSNAPTGATNNYAGQFLGGFGVSVNHIVGNSSALTSTLGTGAGAGATATLTGNDAAGTIAITTAGVPAGSNASIITLTFNGAYGVAPVVLLTNTGPNSAALGTTTQVYVDDAATTTTTFVLKGGSVGLTTGIVYRFSYHVIGK